VDVSAGAFARGFISFLSPFKMYLTAPKMYESNAFEKTKNNVNN
jgi:hypothetical protein